MTSKAAVVVLALSTAADAQPAPSAEADALFDQGRELMHAGKIADACEAFDASQKIAPAVSTLLNQADCREQNRQYATAYGLFRDAERQTRTPLDERTQGLNKLARDRSEGLEQRLSKLTIVVPERARVGGLEILRDGVAIDPLAWGHPLPIDGGTYTITARAPGHELVTSTVQVQAEHDAQTVTIRPLAVNQQPPPSVLPSPRRSHVVPLVVGGSAAVMLGSALGLDLWARHEYADSQVEADDPRQISLWEGAKRKRYLAQGLLVAGVATAGIATWLYLRSGHEHAVVVAPAVDGQSAAVLVRGGF